MALADLHVGLTGSYTVTVEERHTAHAQGHTGVHVLATPTLILFCEIAADHAIRHAYGPNDSTVGLHNDIWHLAAALAGQSVTIDSELIEIDGRKLRFAISGRVGDKELTRGIHERVWVDLPRFLARLGTKR
jgi:fluoroacetyl-CoA thioesterase